MSLSHRLIALLGLLLAADIAEGQPVPVLQNPGAVNQTVAQGAGSTLSVNRFEQIRYADQFLGGCAGDIGCAVKAAITDLGAGGGIVEIPPNPSGTPAGAWRYSTPIQISTGNTWVRCQGWGTTLIYTPSTGYAVILGNQPSPGSAAATITPVRFSDCTLMTLTGGSTATGVIIEGGMTQGNSVDHINFNAGLGFQVVVMVGDGSLDIHGNPVGAYDNYVQHNVIVLNPSTGGASPPQNGVVAYSRTHNLVISDNAIIDYATSNDSSVCVSVANSSSVKILNNNIQGCWAKNVQVGMTQLSTNGLATNATIIRDNYFEPGGSGTLDVDVGKYAVGTVIAGNYENGGGTQGHMIQIENGSNGVVIRDNTQLGIASGSVINNLGTQAPLVEGNTL